MDDVNGCDEVRLLLSELATGALTGQERAAALRHVATCAGCRQELAELSKTADNLLLIAPEAEPPGGFESRVMAQLNGVTRARPRRVLAAAVAAAFVGAMVLGAGAVWWHTGPDRTLAEQTRQTMAVANGRYLHAAPLLTTAGTRAGTVFLYQGSPSWLLVSVTAAPANGPFTMSVIGRDGQEYRAGTCQVTEGAATTGYQLAVPVKSIAAIEMEGPRSTRLTARI